MGDRLLVRLMDGARVAGRRLSFDTKGVYVGDTCVSWDRIDLFMYNPITRELMRQKAEVLPKAMDALADALDSVSAKQDDVPPKVTLTDGSPVTADHKEIDPATGMQKGYVVLSEEERAKGYVRPVRRAYRHVGVKPEFPVRDLTDEEKARVRNDYVAFEAYPEERAPVTGRYWTQAQLNGGCGAVTVMGHTLAETYARDPKFYGGTFCVGCGKHLPVAEFVWDGTDEVVGS